MLAAAQGTVVAVPRRATKSAVASALEGEGVRSPFVFSFLVFPLSVLSISRTRQLRT